MTVTQTSENPAAQLAGQQRGSQETRPRHHQGAQSMTTAYDTSVSTLKAMLTLPFRGVAIVEDRDYGVPEQCEYCGMAGALGTVRVYGEPGGYCSDIAPVELVEICQQCAPDLILRAVAEQDERSRRPIRVEVAA